MGNIQPEKVINALRKQGMEVNIEQAKTIIEFLQKLAAIFVSQYVKNINRNND